jgi:hypothetical protein
VVEILNWLRNNEVKLDVNAHSTALTNLAGAPMPKGKLTPAKKKAIDDAMNWLRTTTPPGDVDDPTAQGLANLLDYPCPASARRRGPKWLRIVNCPQQRCEAEGRQRATLTALTNLGTPMPKGH